eukprot:COSAG01_NODE_43759_length_426_cov_1.556575_2_plen_25_part_01
MLSRGSLITQWIAQGGARLLVLQTV